LDSNYPGLFGEEPNKREYGTGQGTKGGSNFMEYFGWQYCTKIVSEYEAIPLQEAYELKIIHYLNSLSYLKAKSDFDSEAIRKIK
jgi:hypothetical protein